MKLLIPIDQRASIAAGYDAPNSTELVEIPAHDIPERIRQILGAGWDPATGKITIWRNGLGHAFPALAAPITPERIFAAIDAVIAAKEEEARQWQRQREQQEAETAQKAAAHRVAEDAAIDAFMSDPAARGDSSGCLVLAATGEMVDVRSCIFPGERGIYIPDKHPQYADVRAEVRRRNDADATERDRVAAETKAARKQFIADWVCDHGTESQRARLADGLLPEREILDAIQQSAIPFAVFEPRTCQSPDCPCFDSSADGLPDAPYAVWQRVKSALPKGATAKFSRVRECGDSDDEDAYPPEITYDAEVTVPVGPLTFTQRIALVE